MSRYVLVFMPNTCAYRCHAAGCKAAEHNPLAKKLPVMRLDPLFDTVAQARAFADADESEKAGASVQASFKACKCCG